MIIKINEKEFKKNILQSKETIMIIFTANWCEPCKTLKSIIKDNSNDFKKNKIYIIDVDENTKLSSFYKILNIPTIIVLKNGKEIKRSMGVISKEQIIKLFNI